MAMDNDDDVCAQEQQKKQQQEEEQQRQAEESPCYSGEDSKVPDERCTASEHFTKVGSELRREGRGTTMRDCHPITEQFRPDQVPRVILQDGLAMRVVLFFLPGILYRLPSRIRNMLDLGAGPTVYLPIACRERVERIYTSDYAPANRESLVAYIEKRNPFDWTKVCHWIATLEATLESPEKMQEDARVKMQAVLEVNVHASPVVRGITWKRSQDTEIPQQFQLVSTIFCLEYSAENLQEYLRAVKGACSLIEPGGYLLQGGCLDADCYNFGGKRFSSHRLTKEHVIMGLEENGMCFDEESADFKFIVHEECYLFISKKLQ